MVLLLLNSNYGLKTTSKLHQFVKLYNIKYTYRFDIQCFNSALIIWMNTTFFFMITLCK